MKRFFLIFDVGQTLIYEWDFIDFFDKKLLELINGFGGRIDRRNYITLKNNIIKNRLIGNGGLDELIITICRLILPIGYDKIILKKIKPDGEKIGLVKSFTTIAGELKGDFGELKLEDELFGIYHGTNDEIKKSLILAN